MKTKIIFPFIVYISYHLNRSNFFFWLMSRHVDTINPFFDTKGRKSISLVWNKICQKRKNDLEITNKGLSQKCWGVERTETSEWK